MEHLPLIAAAIVVILFAASMVSVGALRWTSFARRVDRRTNRRHQFEASWGDVISAAERQSNAARAKSLAGDRRDTR